VIVITAHPTAFRQASTCEPSQARSTKRRSKR